MDELIPLLFTLIDRSHSSNTVAVRVAALKCLAEFPGKIPYSLIHPLKPKVLKNLSEALDDHKRLVRREAVVCRNKWYGV